MDNKGCANGISEFIINVSLQNDIKINCSKQRFGNESEIEKIYSFIR